MIKSISLSNVATYPATPPVVLDDLREVNYIFGPNATGKTTISRVIADAAFSSTCQCTWKDGRPLEAMVLNRHFVDENFEQLRGVFTLGEKDKDIDAKLAEATAQLERERQDLASKIRTLRGEDGAGGKNSELADLESKTREKFWVPIEKIKKARKLNSLSLNSDTQAVCLSVENLVPGKG